MRKLDATKLIVEILVVVACGASAFAMNIHIRSFDKFAEAVEDKLDVQNFTLSTHGALIAEMQGNRLTSADGLELWKEIGATRERVAQLPTEDAPAWLKQDVDDIKREVRRLAQAVAKLETEIRHERNGHD